VIGAACSLGRRQDRNNAAAGASNPITALILENSGLPVRRPQRSCVGLRIARARARPASAAGQEDHEVIDDEARAARPEDSRHSRSRSGSSMRFHCAARHAADAHVPQVIRPQGAISRSRRIGSVPRAYTDSSRRSLAALCSATRHSARPTVPAQETTREGYRGTACRSSCRASSYPTKTTKTGRSGFKEE
jgi:hypothetical protein